MRFSCNLSKTWGNPKNLNAKSPRREDIAEVDPTPLDYRLAKLVDGRY